MDCNLARKEDLPQQVCRIPNAILYFLINFLERRYVEGPVCCLLLVELQQHEDVPCREEEHLCGSLPLGRPKQQPRTYPLVVAPEANYVHQCIPTSDRNHLDRGSMHSLPRSQHLHNDEKWAMKVPILSHNHQQDRRLNFLREEV